MFSHIMLGVDDMETSRAFYDAALGALGIAKGVADARGRTIYATDRGILMLTRPIDGGPASCANGGTIGFSAQSTDAVDAWHVAGVGHGGATCEDPPGVRDSPFGKLYLAYMRDPAGNKLCAMHRLPA